MMQFQVRLENAEENEAVQKALFSLGYVWNDEIPFCGSSVVRNVYSTVTPVLFCSARGYIAKGTLHCAKSLQDTYPVANAEKIIAEAEKRKPKIEPPASNGLLDAAIRTLKNLGYEYKGGEFFVPPVGKASFFDEFWMVLNTKNGATRVQHESQDIAEKEAERIAAREPEAEIVVLKAVSMYKGTVSVGKSFAVEKRTGAK
jgi:hypothetical protein